MTDIVERLGALTIADWHGRGYIQSSKVAEQLIYARDDACDEIIRLRAKAEVQATTLEYMGALVERLEQSDTENERLRETLHQMKATIEARSELFISDQECMYNLLDRIRRALA